MKLRVAAATLNQTPLDWSGNLRRIRQAIEQARQQEVQLLLMPELCLTGYGCEDVFHAEQLHDYAWEQLLSLLPLTNEMVVVLGVPLRVRKQTYNAAALLVRQQLVGLVCKQTLPQHDLFYEPRWFQPWIPGKQELLERNGLQVPFGDICFDLGGVRVGMEICEDAWGTSRPAQSLAFQDVDLILNPSASPFSFGKTQLRQQLVTESARSTATTYLYANLLGNEAGRIIYEGSTLISHGRQGIVASGRCFSFTEFQMTTAIVDLRLTRLDRSKLPARTTSESSLHCIFCPFSWKSLPISLKSTAKSLAPPLSKHEEFTHAVSLGLWDYLRKSHSRSFVVSASGGADSSSLVVLVYLMLRLADEEMGRAKLVEYLTRLWSMDLPADISLTELMSRLLLTIYQSSENSSATTRSAARTVCESVGARHFEYDIQPLLDQHCGWMEQQLERPLDWQQDDLALQNIQARVRAPGAWFLTNLHSALLLSTSNRSEAAVGYATMDGDTAGGLSPLGGIDKAYLREWLRWLEKEGLPMIGPLPFLHCVNEQEPTAELRPLAAAQSDEDDLMPYHVLDAIERAAIREHRWPLEIWHDLQDHFPDLPPVQLAHYTERFFRLWCRNQWKRERLAPSFHLDEENLDPKTWCRFPILSGNFETELEALRAAAHPIFLDS
ncbi:MAG: NAD(+) synthase [Deltaproteobacteria bacterium]|nr:NAD(+) synthase [Deltaproteobacteria bacterium]